MSSFAGVCCYCLKPVMHKTFFGTLHLCLTSEEKMMIDQYSRQQSQQPPYDNTGYAAFFRVIAGARKAYKSKTAKEEE